MGCTQETLVQDTPPAHQIGLFVGDRDKREDQRWKQASFDLNDDLKGLWMNAMQESGEGRKRSPSTLGEPMAELKWRSPMKRKADEYVFDAMDPEPAQMQPWISLTDEDRDRAFQTLPDMLDGFMKKWGWLHFAKAIEDICREKNGHA